jgi:hypothetical protein
MIDATARAALPALILISTEGEPVMLVPAPSIEEAQQRAITLLRASPAGKSGIAHKGCRATLFVPALEADGEVLAYQPARAAEHGTNNKVTAMRSRSH